MPRLHALASVALFAAFSMPAKADTRYMTVVNRSYDDIVSIAIAREDNDAFREFAIDAPLHGGGGAETVQIGAQGCRYDFRFRLRDGTTRTQRGIDVCRHDRMVLRPVSRDARPVAGSAGASR